MPHEVAALLLLVWATVASGGEPVADPATARIREDAFLVVRFAPAQRLDAVGREIGSLMELLEAERPLGEALLGDVLAGEAPVDRTKPCYFALWEGGSGWLFHALPDADPETLPASVTLADGMLRVGDGAGEPRPPGKPFPLLEADVSVVCPVGRLVDQHRETIEKALADLPGVAERQELAQLPPALVAFVQTIARKALDAVMGVEDVHYALTWRGKKLESEGWIRTREGSALRRWLGQVSPAAPPDLLGLLPARAFWTVESGGMASALDGDVARLIDASFGEGTGHAILLLLSPSYALHGHLTGRAAGVILVQGFMAMSMQSIHEGKPGLAEAAAALDPAETNRVLARLGVPLALEIERDVAKSGETRIHRLSYRAADPQLAMLTTQMQTCFAVEKGHLLVVQSVFAETEIRGLIDRVRDGARTEHPHQKAMARLMPDRHEGLTLNLGTLKPFLGMFAMAVPEAAKVVTLVPDDLCLSTALAVRDGHIHIRGDWPLLEVAEFAAKAQKAFEDR